MLSITRRRRQQFCRKVLGDVDAVIGFADVGSGGALKHPWNMLPAECLRKFDFEPTADGGGKLPVCVSNHDGKADFFVARDERGSSFHRASPALMARFGLQSLEATRAIEVECVTLDRFFDGKYEALDALDVNVEGHDYQVLQGGTQLLRTGNIKLIKVEFEVAEVWKGQGWLSDIDPLLRRLGYCLAGINIDFVRPLKVRHCFHPGEPLWRKALYVPSPERWTELVERLRSQGNAALEQAIAKAAALYVAADIPGQALDVVELGARSGGLRRLDPVAIDASVRWVYRWAKAEHGLGELRRLAGRAVGAMKGARAEA